MGIEIRRTRSVCPVCLKNLPAALVREGGGAILLQKRCPDHGSFSVPVWAGAMDFDGWISGAAELAGNVGLGCPENCGLCAEHEEGSCCTLLEVTRRCNLRCRFCFANGGAAEADPTTDELKAAIADIGRKCPGTMLQLSGGEPTLRDDLPALISHAKAVGCSYVQLNTNGIRLAEEPDYAAALAAAGLDIVFLQFDGTKDEIYQTLRGKALLDTKLNAIAHCGKSHIGVTLVPTVVQGVNTEDLGNLVRLAASLSPAVRGVHFQPVSYFGRYPGSPEAADRFTLDQLMAAISVQAEIPPESFLPSRCDHPLCGFHANYLIAPDGTLKSLTASTRTPKGRSCASVNREYVAKHWRGTPAEPTAAGAFSAEMDFDTFLYYLRHRSLSLSAMAFQDAVNLNVERLHRCSLHVYAGGKIKPFCANYLTPIR